MMDPAELPPDPELALELVRATEAAAIAAARFMGRGDTEKANLIRAPAGLPGH
jgi:fructose-1,6-bisphosphatase/sedoheptulose 1,7-bisphosphatase-like protein